MGWTHAVYKSVHDVPRSQWLQLFDHETDLTWDRRLLGAFECTMGKEYRCFTIVISDSNGRAVGLACNWLFEVDLSQFAWLKPFMAFLPNAWRKGMRLGVLFCGMPIPAGQNHIRIAPGADPNAVVARLDLALRELAQRESAKMIVIKEFDSTECEQFGILRDAKYFRAHLPPRHRFDRRFANFDEYCETLRSRYRSQVQRSIRKFDAAGFEVEQVYGPDQLPEAYTAEAHQLYEAVWNRSKYKLEFFPAEFMRELGRRFGPDASMTCIRKGDRLAGFTLGVMSNGIYHNLYSGLDYELNGQADVYFNLFYRDLDYAWRRGASEVHLGLTSDDFKARLGSRIEPLYLYVAATNSIVAWGMWKFSDLIFPRVAAVEEHHVFKDVVPTERRAKVPARA